MTICVLEFSLSLSSFFTASGNSHQKMKLKRHYVTRKREYFSPTREVQSYPTKSFSFFRGCFQKQINKPIDGYAQSVMDDHTPSVDHWSSFRNTFKTCFHLQLKKSIFKCLSNGKESEYPFWLPEKFP